MKMRNLLLTIKIMLISSGVVSLAMAINLALPVVINFTVYELPTVYSVFLSLFKPPYLFVIINAIIITIVASTRFTQKDSLPFDEQSQPLISVKMPQPVQFSDTLGHTEVSRGLNHVEYSNSSDRIEASNPLARAEFPDELAHAPPVVEEFPDELAHAPPIVEEFPYEENVLNLKKPVLENDLEVVEDEDQVITKEVDVVGDRSIFTPPQTIINQELEAVTVSERPLALSRFGPRKPLKGSPEGGRTLRVARPRKQETLESTWRMITEGRHVPLTRHFKKSETMENHGRHMEMTTPDENCSPQNWEVKKWETFKDRTNYQRESLACLRKIRKEPSLGQDELNRRVEAFIKKFNEDMKLQREESLKQYMEMINRGAY